MKKTDEAGLNLTFGERLKKLIADNNISQKELAAYIGMSPSAISHLQRGKETNFRNLVAIADYFNVTIDYLLGKEELPTRRETDFFRLLKEQLKLDVPDDVLKEHTHQIADTVASLHYMLCQLYLKKEPIPDINEAANLMIKEINDIIAYNNEVSEESIRASIYNIKQMASLLLNFWEQRLWEDHLSTNSDSFRKLIRDVIVKF